jgi:two-component system sensor histidine kinase ChiS
MTIFKKTIPAFAILLVCVFLFSCSNHGTGQNVKIEAQNGVIDLSEYDFKKHGPVKLSGEWAFYWNRFITPEIINSEEITSTRKLIRFPSIWNSHKHEGKEVGSNGYATYHLRVKVNKTDEQLALKILTFSTAHQLFANGKEISRAGTPGTTRETSEPMYNPEVVEVEPENGILDIVIYISNFHYKKGGPWRTILIGIEDDLRQMRNNSIYFSIFLFGCFIIMGLYHLTLFLLRRGDHAPLYFGLMCLAFSGRVIATNEYFIITMIPSIPFEAIIKTEYLSMYIGVPLFAMFWRSLYKDYYFKHIFTIVLVISAIASLTVLVTGADIYTYTIVPFQIMTALLIIYCFIVLTILSFQKKEGAFFFVLGFLFVGLTAINDMLNSNYIIRTYDLLPFGFLFFVFSMAFLMSKRFAGAFSRAENLSIEIGQKNVELKKMDKLKDEFLANTSHELKTPLNGIIGLAESLLDGVEGPMNEMQAENLRMIASSGKRLAHLVNDILDLSKLKNSEIFLKQSPIDVWQLTEIVFTMSKPLLNSEEVMLVNNIPESIPLVQGDEDRIQQVLHNLIGNSIKFTRQGTITVSAKIEQNGGSRFIAVSVSDTGIGIPGDKMDDIFKSFEQADGSIEREYGGTGLGLAITKSLIELHGGTIEVTSEVDKGTTFTFTLPAYTYSGTNITAYAKEANNSKRMEKPEVEQDTKELFMERERSTYLYDYYRKRKETDHRYRALVVDDDTVNLQVVNNYLKTAGYDTIPAISGFAALETLKQYKPDVILLDVMMPRMSGYETAHRIREKFTCEELPIIFLTAKGQSRDVIDGFHSGGNDYITKPFTRDELITRVDFQVALKEAVNESRALAAIEQELEIAKKIQQSIVPGSIPESKQFDISTIYLPTSKMGGDYYDFYFPDNEELQILVADVSGHGLPAAHITSMVKVAYSLQKNEKAAPDTVLINLNNILTGAIEDFFITAECISINREKGKLFCARAGHLPLLIYRKKQEKIEKISPKGKAIGFNKDYSYELIETNIETGDRIILHTDGLTEARNSTRGKDSKADDEQLFGEMILDDFITDNSDSTSSEFAGLLIEGIQKWTGRQEEQEDDITVIIVDIK